MDKQYQEIAIEEAQALWELGITDFLVALSPTSSWDVWSEFDCVDGPGWWLLYGTSAKHWRFWVEVE
jgi:hypothetical protein